MKAEGFAASTLLQAWLEDSYLNTKKEINLGGTITPIDFTVNSESASYSTNRFRIVFQNNAVVLPVVIKDIQATVQNGGVSVSWTIANEANLLRYTLERATDGGRTYSQIAVVQAKNNTSETETKYTSFDALPKWGDNLYRIKMESKDGTVSYSDIVLITFGEKEKNMHIAVYPNPVTDGKLNLQLSNLTPGKYLANLYSMSGQPIYQHTIVISQPNSTQNEQLLPGNTVAQGYYQLRITDNKGTVIKQTNVAIIR